MLPSVQRPFELCRAVEQVDEFVEPLDTLNSLNMPEPSSTVQPLLLSDCGAWQVTMKMTKMRALVVGCSGVAVEATEESFSWYFYVIYIFIYIYISYIFILIWIWILFLYDFYTILCQLSHLRWGPLCPLWPKLSTSSRPPPRSWRIWCCRVLEQCQRSESFTALDHDRAATCCLTIPDYDFAILYNNIILCGWPCNHMQPYLSRMRWPWLIRSLQRSRRLPS